MLDDFNCQCEIHRLIGNGQRWAIEIHRMKADAGNVSWRRDVQTGQPPIAVIAQLSEQRSRSAADIKNVGTPLRQGLENLIDDMRMQPIVRTLRKFHVWVCRAHQSENITLTSLCDKSFDGGRRCRQTGIGPSQTRPTMADMVPHEMLRTLVVNFNSPELHQLALALAHRDGLSAYVRPYANKGRAWERMLSTLPMAGAVYGRTFGRRQLRDAALGLLTHEAGVLPDLCAAVIGRTHALPTATRHRWTNRLVMSVRDAVAEAACRHVEATRCVVAYEGFALPAFRMARRCDGRLSVLNYPVAHHRQRRRVRLEEIDREPAFASTWPDFGDWPDGHEERLDEEIDLADVVLVGSTYVSDSFEAEGVDRSKMRVVPYGVDLQVFAPGPSRTRPAAFNVIYTGQLTQRKGLSYLLRGYQKFARRGTQLTLVGSVVDDFAPLLPFAHLFRHVAHQTRPALAAMYREADVFVLPTLIEGMPLVVLEAMACGLPVIVTANGPADIVRDGIDGFVIPERDEDALCDRLEILHAQPERRVEMGRRAALRAREFGWDTYAATALRALDDLREAVATRS